MHTFDIPCVISKANPVMIHAIMDFTDSPNISACQGAHNAPKVKPDIPPMAQYAMGSIYFGIIFGKSIVIAHKNAQI